MKPETEAYWRNRHNAKIALLAARQALQPVIPSTNPVSIINDNGAIPTLPESIDAIQPPLAGPDPIVDGNNTPQPSHDSPRRTDEPSSPSPVSGEFGEDHGIGGNHRDYMSDDYEPAENHDHRRITPNSTMNIDSPPTLRSYGCRSPITPPNTPNRSPNISIHLTKYNDAIRSPSIPRRMTNSPPHNTNLRRLEPRMGTMLNHGVERRPPVTPTNLSNRQPNPSLFDTRQTAPPASGNKYSTHAMNSPNDTPRRSTSSFFSSQYTPDEHGTVPRRTFNAPSSRRSLSTFPPVPRFPYPPLQPTTYTFSNTGSPNQLQRVTTPSRTEPPDHPSFDVMDCNRMFENSRNLPHTFRTENRLSPNHYRTVDPYIQHLTRPMNNLSMIRRDDRAKTRNPTAQIDSTPNFTRFNARNPPPVTIEHSSSELRDVFRDFEFNSSSVQGNIAFDKKEIEKIVAAFHAQRSEECGDSYTLSLKGIAEIRKFRDKLLFMNLCLKCFRTELKDGGGKHALVLLFERFDPRLILLTDRDTELVTARSEGMIKGYLDQSGPNQPTIIQHLASRLINLQGFQEEYIQSSVNRGYLLEFCYECMHEDISIVFPDKVGVSQLDPVNITRARHNKTLAKIIKAWKPKLENVEQTLKNMKIPLLHYCS